ncbi:MAG: fumarate hydratase class I [Saprospiraceae bacterium]|jgi:fumarate hydratase class I
MNSSMNLTVNLIREDDFISSVADALQYISCYHSQDFVDAMHRAWQIEKSPSAKDAIAQILINSKMAATGRRPICQDTGIVVAFIKVGMNVRFDTQLSLQQLVDEGVRQAYNNIDNPLRHSVVSPPFGKRMNTGDNSPAVVYTELVQGDDIEIKIAAKGGGSENKAKFTVLNPSDSIVDWVIDTVPKMGAGWCPPGVLGIGIGGSPEKSMVLAKEALLDPIDITELQARGPQNPEEELRLDIMDAVNQLGIGAQGLGGLTTVLDVKVNTYPTHAASLPLSMIPNCAATRHIHFHLDGSGPAVLTPPDLNNWPDITQSSEDVGTPVDLNNITQAQLETWQPGQPLLLSGSILTGRDAAHKRIQQILDEGKPLPVDFKNRFIYYVGPVDPIEGEAVGPAGPTTATRMDKFTEMMLGDQVGVMGMIGKAERGDAAIEVIRQHKSVYLIAVGGAAYLVSKAIKKAKVLAFEDMGMEAIYEFEVENMPVTVAVDSLGDAVHKSGPKKWQGKAQPIRVQLS